ncbi:hypothetical protein FACS1894132_10020 [Clostridia bacterium]|nr:hypothetical protein FACS1894132_10020 [Clostridia bacterium]
MLRNIPKSDLIGDFWLEDIHAIREWHYEILKDATTQEFMDF